MNMSSKSSYTVGDIPIWTVDRSGNKYFGQDPELSIFPVVKKLTARFHPHFDVLESLLANIDYFIKQFALIRGNFRVTRLVAATP